MDLQALLAADAGTRLGESRARVLDLLRAAGGPLRVQEVCALHLGLMQGVLAQLRAPVTADSLQPFTEPSVCTAQLSTGE